MNEKKRNHVVEEAEMEPADIPAPVAKNYTLRGALQAIERREAAVAKREQKILKLQYFVSIAARNKRIQPAASALCTKQAVAF